MTGQAVRNDVEQFIAELTEPTRIGNDIVNFLKRIQEWAAALGVDQMARQGLDIAYHYALEVLVPKLRELLPTYGDLIMDTIALPLLKKFHDAYLHVQTN